MWLSRGSMPLTARRAPAGRRAGRAAARCRSSRCRRHGRARPICSGGKGSTAKAARIMSSTPRPGSTVSSRSANRPRDGAGRGSAGRCRGGSARPGRRRGERRGRAGALPSPPAPGGGRDPRSSRSVARSEIGGIGDRLGKAQPHPPDRRLAQAATTAPADRRVPDRGAAPPPRRNGGRARRAASHRDRRPASSRPAADPERSPGRGAAPRPATARGRRASLPAAE